MDKLPVVGAFRLTEYDITGVCGVCEYLYNSAPISRAVALRRAITAIQYAPGYVVDHMLEEIAK